jgi:hypothetical protein
LYNVTLQWRGLRPRWFAQVRRRLKEFKYGTYAYINLTIILQCTLHYSGEAYDRVGSRKFVADLKDFKCDTYAPETPSKPAANGKGKPPKNPNHHTGRVCERPIRTYDTFFKGAFKLNKIARVLELNQVGTKA